MATMVTTLALFVCLALLFLGTRGQLVTHEQQIDGEIDGRETEFQRLNKNIEIITNALAFIEQTIHPLRVTGPDDGPEPVPQITRPSVPSFPAKTGLSTGCLNDLCNMFYYALTCKAIGIDLKKVQV